MLGVKRRLMSHNLFKYRCNKSTHWSTSTATELSFNFPKKKKKEKEKSASPFPKVSTSCLIIVHHSTTIGLDGRPKPPLLPMIPNAVQLPNVKKPGCLKQSGANIRYETENILHIMFKIRSWLSSAQLCRSVKWLPRLPSLSSLGSGPPPFRCLVLYSHIGCLI